MMQNTTKKTQLTKEVEKSVVTLQTISGNCPECAPQRKSKSPIVPKFVTYTRSPKEEARRDMRSRARRDEQSKRRSWFHRNRVGFLGTLLILIFAGQMALQIDSVIPHDYPVVASGSSIPAQFLSLTQEDIAADLDKTFPICIANGSYMYVEMYGLDEVGSGAFAVLSFGNASESEENRDEYVCYPGQNIFCLTSGYEEWSNPLDPAAGGATVYNLSIPLDQASRIKRIAIQPIVIASGCGAVNRTEGVTTWQQDFKGAGPLSLLFWGGLMNFSDLYIAIDKGQTGQIILKDTAYETSLELPTILVAQTFEGSERLQFDVNLEGMNHTLTIRGEGIFTFIILNTLGDADFDGKSDVEEYLLGEQVSRADMWVANIYGTKTEEESGLSEIEIIKDEKIEWLKGEIEFEIPAIYGEIGYPLDLSICVTSGVFANFSFNGAPVAPNNLTLAGFHSDSTEEMMQQTDNGFWVKIPLCDTIVQNRFSLGAVVPGKYSVGYTYLNDPFLPQEIVLFVSDIPVSIIAYEVVESKTWDTDKDGLPDSAPDPSPNAKMDYEANSLLQLVLPVPSDQSADVQVEFMVAHPAAEFDLSNDSLQWRANEPNSPQVSIRPVMTLYGPGDSMGNVGDWWQVYTQYNDYWDTLAEMAEYLGDTAPLAVNTHSLVVADAFGSRPTFEGEADPLPLPGYDAAYGYYDLVFAKAAETTWSFGPLDYSYDSPALIDGCLDLRIRFQWAIIELDPVTGADKGLLGLYPMECDLVIQSITGKEYARGSTNYVVGAPSSHTDSEVLYHYCQRPDVAIRVNGQPAAPGKSGMDNALRNAIIGEGIGVRYLPSYYYDAENRSTWSVLEQATYDYHLAYYNVSAGFSDVPNGKLPAGWYYRYSYNPIPSSGTAYSVSVVDHWGATGSSGRDDALVVNDHDSYMQVEAWADVADISTGNVTFDLASDPAHTGVFRVGLTHREDSGVWPVAILDFVPGYINYGTYEHIFTVNADNNFRTISLVFNHAENSLDISFNGVTVKDLPLLNVTSITDFSIWTTFDGWSEIAVDNLTIVSGRAGQYNREPVVNYFATTETSVDYLYKLNQSMLFNQYTQQSFVMYPGNDFAGVSPGTPITTGTSPAWAVIDPAITVLENYHAHGNVMEFGAGEVSARKTFGGAHTEGTASVWFSPGEDTNAEFVLEGEENTAVARVRVRKDLFLPTVLEYAHLTPTGIEWKELCEVWKGEWFQIIFDDFNTSADTPTVDIYIEGVMHGLAINVSLLTSTTSIQSFKISKTAGGEPLLVDGAYLLDQDADAADEYGLSFPEFHTGDMTLRYAWSAVLDVYGGVYCVFDAALQGAETMLYTTSFTDVLHERQEVAVGGIPLQISLRRAMAGTNFEYTHCLNISYGFGNTLLLTENLGGGTNDWVLGDVPEAIMYFHEITFETAGFVFDETDPVSVQFDPSLGDVLRHVTDNRITEVDLWLRIHRRQSDGLSEWGRSLVNRIKAGHREIVKLIEDAKILINEIDKEIHWQDDPNRYYINPTQKYADFLGQGYWRLDAETGDWIYINKKFQFITNKETLFKNLLNYETAMAGFIDLMDADIGSVKNIYQNVKINLDGWHTYCDTPDGIQFLEYLHSLGIRATADSPPVQGKLYQSDIDKLPSSVFEVMSYDEPGKPIKQIYSKKMPTVVDMELKLAAMRRVIGAKTYEDLIIRYAGLGQQDLSKSMGYLRKYGAPPILDLGDWDQYWTSTRAHHFYSDAEMNKLMSALGNDEMVEIKVYTGLMRPRYRKAIDDATGGNTYDKAISAYVMRSEGRLRMVATLQIPDMQSDIRFRSDSSRDIGSKAIYDLRIGMKMMRRFISAARGSLGDAEEIKALTGIGYNIDALMGSGKKGHVIAEESIAYGVGAGRGDIKGNSLFEQLFQYERKLQPELGNKKRYYQRVARSGRKTIIEPTEGRATPALFKNPPAELKPLVAELPLWYMQFIEICELSRSKIQYDTDKRGSWLLPGELEVRLRAIIGYLATKYSTRTFSITYDSGKGYIHVSQDALAGLLTPSMKSVPFEGMDAINKFRIALNKPAASNFEHLAYLSLIESGHDAVNVRERLLSSIIPDKHYVLPWLEDGVLAYTIDQMKAGKLGDVDGKTKTLASIWNGYRFGPGTSRKIADYNKKAIAMWLRDYFVQSGVDDLRAPILLHGDGSSLEIRRRIINNRDCFVITDLQGVVLYDKYYIVPFSAAMTRAELEGAAGSDTSKIQRSTGSGLSEIDDAKAKAKAMEKVEIDKQSAGRKVKNMQGDLNKYISRRGDSSTHSASDGATKESNSPGTVHATNSPHGIEVDSGTGQVVLEMEETCRGFLAWDQAKADRIKNFLDYNGQKLVTLEMLQKLHGAITIDQSKELLAIIHGLSFEVEQAALLDPGTRQVITEGDIFTVVTDVSQQEIEAYIQYKYGIVDEGITSLIIVLLMADQVYKRFQTGDAVSISWTVGATVALSSVQVYKLIKTVAFHRIYKEEGEIASQIYKYNPVKHGFWDSFGLPVLMDAIFDFADMWDMANDAMEHEMPVTEAIAMALVRYVPTWFIEAAFDYVAGAAISAIWSSGGAAAAAGSSIATFGIGMIIGLIAFWLWNWYLDSLNAQYNHDVDLNFNEKMVKVDWSPALAKHGGLRVGDSLYYATTWENSGFASIYWRQRAAAGGPAGASTTAWDTAQQYCLTATLHDYDLLDLPPDTEQALLEWEYAGSTIEGEYMGGHIGVMGSYAAFVADHAAWIEGVCAPYFKLPSDPTTWTTGGWAGSFGGYTPRADNRNKARYWPLNPQEDDYDNIQNEPANWDCFAHILPILEATPELHLYVTNDLDNLIKIDLIFSWFVQDNDPDTSDTLLGDLNYDGYFDLDETPVRVLEASLSEFMAQCTPSLPDEVTFDSYLMNYTLATARYQWADAGADLNEALLHAQLAATLTEAEYQTVVERLVDFSDYSGACILARNFDAVPYISEPVTEYTANNYYLLQTTSYAEWLDFLGGEQGSNLIAAGWRAARPAFVQGEYLYNNNFAYTADYTFPADWIWAGNVQPLTHTEPTGGRGLVLADLGASQFVTVARDFGPLFRGRLTMSFQYNHSEPFYFGMAAAGATSADWVDVAMLTVSNGYFYFDGQQLTGLTQVSELTITEVIFDFDYKANTIIIRIQGQSFTFPFQTYMPVTQFRAGITGVDAGPTHLCISSLSVSTILAQDAYLSSYCMTNPAGQIFVPKKWVIEAAQAYRTLSKYAEELDRLPCLINIHRLATWTEIPSVDAGTSFSSSLQFTYDGPSNPLVTYTLTPPSGWHLSVTSWTAPLKELVWIPFTITAPVNAPAGIYYMTFEERLADGSANDGTVTYYCQIPIQVRYSASWNLDMGSLPDVASPGSAYTWAQLSNNGTDSRTVLITGDGVPIEWVSADGYTPIVRWDFTGATTSWSYTGTGDATFQDLENYEYIAGYDRDLGLIASDYVFEDTPTMQNVTFEMFKPETHWAGAENLTIGLEFASGIGYPYQPSDGTWGEAGATVALTPADENGIATGPAIWQMEITMIPLDQPMLIRVPGAGHYVLYISSGHGNAEAIAYGSYPEEYVPWNVHYYGIGNYPAGWVPWNMFTIPKVATGDGTLVLQALFTETLTAEAKIDAALMPGDRVHIIYKNTGASSVTLGAWEEFDLTGSEPGVVEERMFTAGTFVNLDHLNITAQVQEGASFIVYHIAVERCLTRHSPIVEYFFAGQTTDLAGAGWTTTFGSGTPTLWLEDDITNAVTVSSVEPDTNFNDAAHQGVLSISKNDTNSIASYFEVPLAEDVVVMTGYQDFDAAQTYLSAWQASILGNNFYGYGSEAFDETTLTFNTQPAGGWGPIGALAWREFSESPYYYAGWSGYTLDLSDWLGRYIFINCSATGEYLSLYSDETTAYGGLAGPKVVVGLPKAGVTGGALVLQSDTTELFAVSRALREEGQNVTLAAGDKVWVSFETSTAGGATLTLVNADPSLADITWTLATATDKGQGQIARELIVPTGGNYTTLFLNGTLTPATNFSLAFLGLFQYQHHGTPLADLDIGGFYNETIAPEDFTTSTPSVLSEVYGHRDVLALQGPGSGDYAALYSFDNNAIGSVPSGWTESYGDAEVVASVGAHDNVAQVIGPNGAYMTNTFDAQASGTIELWVYTPVANQGDNAVIYIEEGIGLAIHCATGEVMTLGSTVLAMVALDHWVHVRIDFDCGTDTWDLYVNGTLCGTDLPMVPITAVTTLQLFSYAVDVPIYFDAVDYSWAPGFVVSRNLYEAVANYTFTTPQTQGRLDFCVYAPGTNEALVITLEGIGGAGIQLAIADYQLWCGNSSGPVAPISLYGGWHSLSVAWDCTLHNYTVLYFNQTILNANYTSGQGILTFTASAITGIGLATNAGQEAFYIDGVCLSPDCCQPSNQSLVETFREGGYAYVTLSPGEEWTLYCTPSTVGVYPNVHFAVYDTQTNRLAGYIHQDITVDVPPSATACPNYGYISGINNDTAISWTILDEGLVYQKTWGVGYQTEPVWWEVRVGETAVSAGTWDASGDIVTVPTAYQPAGTYTYELWATDGYYPMCLLTSTSVSAISAPPTGYVASTDYEYDTYFDNTKYVYWSIENLNLESGAYYEVRENGVAMSPRSFTSGQQFVVYFTFNQMPGTYVYTLFVFDGINPIAQVGPAVTVTALNYAPTSTFPTDYSFMTGQESKYIAWVLFDLGIKMGCGQWAVYRNDISDPVASNDFTMTDQEVDINTANLAPGSYTYSLWVTDGMTGWIWLDDVTVEAINTEPTTTHCEGFTYVSYFDHGDTLSWTITDLGGIDLISANHAEWRIDLNDEQYASGDWGEIDPHCETVTRAFFNQMPGTYTVTFWVRDGYLDPATYTTGFKLCDTTTINVLNTAIEWTSPSDIAHYDDEAPPTITWRLTDYSVNPAAAIWQVRVGTELKGAGTWGPGVYDVNFNTNNNVPGSITYTLWVTDGLMDMASLDSVTVTVTDDDTSWPVITVTYHGNGYDSNPGYFTVAVSDPESGLSSISVVLDGTQVGWDVGDYDLPEYPGYRKLVVTATNNDQDWTGDQESNTKTTNQWIIDDDVTAPTWTFTSYAINWPLGSTCCCQVSDASGIYAVYVLWSNNVQRPCHHDSGTQWADDFWGQFVHPHRFLVWDGDADYGSGTNDKEYKYFYTGL